MSSARLISKTSFLAGHQCPKLLWKKFNEPESIPAVDVAKQAIFDQGHAIGDLAKQLYPGGIEVAEGVVSYKPVAHHEFLAAGRSDPRPAFLEALQAVLPDGGTVVSYHASFENRCLRDCADAFPEHAWATGVPDCNVDLLIPFRSFAYHHRDQHGSASIKSVLPVLTGTDYTHLAIQDGMAAARSFMDAEFGNLSTEERNRIREDLLAYCKLDTQAMIDLVDALKELTSD